MNSYGGSTTMTTAYAFSSSVTSSQSWCHVRTDVKNMYIKIDSNKTSLFRSANISAYVISSLGTYSNYTLFVSQDAASSSSPSSGGGNSSTPPSQPPSTYIEINGESNVSKYTSDQGVYSYSASMNGAASGTASYFWYLEGDNPYNSQVILTNQNTPVVKLDFNNLPDNISDTHFKLKVESSNGLNTYFDIYYIL
ncbi:hypothetical protein [Arachidicoccus soli]|nr:hypothetical protein [Arachidicoccus soli]